MTSYYTPTENARRIAEIEALESLLNDEGRREMWLELPEDDFFMSPTEFDTMLWELFDELTPKYAA